MHRDRIAVITPFLDKQHGAERCLAEQVERLSIRFEIHVYAHYIKDIDLSNGDIFIHRIPEIPGPHMLKYLWFFITNHIWRGYNSIIRGQRYPIRYSPCINCADANVISVHIVFAEFYERIREELRLRRNPIKSWARLIHRRLYYYVIIFLERLIYSNPHLTLTTVSGKTAKDLNHFYSKRDNIAVIYHGIDNEYFNPQARGRKRLGARGQFGVEDRFALLLIGNDWKKKGLPCLLEAIGQLSNPRLFLLVVGQDEAALYEGMITRLGLRERVRFLPPSSDVLQYYAAADLYVGPSLEDAFALPPLEAMACGLPVIVSSRAGVSEIITNSLDGLILQDPTDPNELAEKIQCLYEDSALRCQLAGSAIKTARQYTWDRNAEEIQAIFDKVLNRI